MGRNKKTYKLNLDLNERTILLWDQDPSDNWLKLRTRVSTDIWSAKEYINIPRIFLPLYALPFSETGLEAFKELVKKKSLCCDTSFFEDTGINLTQNHLTETLCSIDERAQKRLARCILCFFWDWNAALVGKTRDSYLKAKFINGFTEADKRMLSFASFKEAGATETGVTPAMIKKWYEEYDIPKNLAYAVNNHEFTIHELVALSRMLDIRNLPKQIQGMRKFVQRTNWESKSAYLAPCSTSTQGDVVSRKITLLPITKTTIR